MKITLASLAITGAIVTPLVACTTQDVLDVIDRVVYATQQACGFVPTVETVAALLNLHWQGIDKATEIANAICEALGAAHTASGDDTAAVTAAMRAVFAPTLRGIVLYGYVTE